LDYNIEGDLGVSNNIAETKKSHLRVWWVIPLSITFLLMGTTAMAQPLPPTSPTGNPVPIGSFATVLLVFGGALLFLRKSKKK